MHYLHKKLFWFVLVFVLGAGGIFAATLKPKTISPQAAVIDQDEPPVPADVSVTPSEVNSVAKDTTALGGYNVLIADRGNNRIIEVTPDKQIVWEYKFDLPRPGLGADDAFFTDGGKTVIVNLEEYHLIEMIDYASKQVIWSYGTAGKAGSAAGLLNTPDDAYKLPGGNVIVADIKNCRIIEITPDKNIAHQYGRTGKCGNTDGLLNKPNGDTPLPDGHILISNIVGHSLVELNEQWQPVFTMNLPVAYPSDPQLTKAGNILISDYSTPGQIVEVSKDGKIVWRFSGEAGDAKLNKPSLSIELPNGHIMSNDDLNHRVIVVDKATNKIIWQYGVTEKPGNGIGQLNIPDGVDIIKRDSGHVSENTSPAMRIGQVSRHALDFTGKAVKLTGYVISVQKDYLIFSDEANGAIGYYDLPVTGAGIEALKAGQKYVIEGNFVKSTEKFVNGYPYVLQLTAPPVPSN